MQDSQKGRIVGVNGNILTVEFPDNVTQNEVAYAIAGDVRLKCEVIRVRGNRADMQVFESTNGLKEGDPVEFTGELLSVELGPGLLTQVYDGLQNPLNELAEQGTAPVLYDRLCIRNRRTVCRRHRNSHWQCEYIILRHPFRAK